MDDIKIFTKIYKELESMTKIRRINTHYIRKEFGTEENAMPITKSGKENQRRGLNYQVKKSIWAPKEIENVKYLRIYEVGIIKQRWKKHLEKKYHKSPIKLLEPNLCSGNHIKRINTEADQNILLVCLCVYSFVRYSGSFLKWIREELRQMDQKT